ncbi:MAG: hypothetical protein A2V70_06210 [Planctomycetes bacterium RBG_13_63_9]|nr:MAG: hypothetical protein A2V70_06210 [Planctomycetes bacterium RBG_13_63_9]
MAAQIPKQLALKIAKKLEATKQGNTEKHDIMGVLHEGQLIASFGIRRGSSKELGHDYIAGQLHVEMRFAKELGTCKKYRPEWIARMIRQGVIPAGTQGD